MSEILLVEDNEMNAIVLKTVLRCFSPYANIRVVQTGRECLLELARMMPSVVFMDVNLPDADGREISKQIKAQFGEKAPPVIGCSAFAHGMTPKECEQNNMIAFIEKPLDPAAVRAVMKIAKIIK
jgi:CheY-like chemotaxis protein